jgi:hypothetical protein
MLSRRAIQHFEKIVRDIAGASGHAARCPVICRSLCGHSPQLIELCSQEEPRGLITKTRYAVVVGEIWLVQNAIPTRAFLRC